MTKIDLKSKKILREFVEEYLNSRKFLSYSVNEKKLSDLINHLNDDNLYDLESISGLIRESCVFLEAASKGREDVIDILVKFMPEEDMYIINNHPFRPAYRFSAENDHIKLMEKLFELYVIYERNHPLSRNEENGFDFMPTIKNKDIVEKLLKLESKYRNSLNDRYSLKSALRGIFSKFYYGERIEEIDIAKAAILAFAVNDSSKLAEIFADINIKDRTESERNKVKPYLDNPQLLIDLGRKRNALIQSGLTHTQIDQAISVAKNISSFAQVSKDPRSVIANIKAQAGNDNIEITKYIADHILSYVGYDSNSNSNLTDAQREAIYDLIKFDQDNFVKQSAKDTAQNSRVSKPRSKIEDEQKSNWLMRGIYKNIGRACITLDEYIVNPIVNLISNRIKDELVETKESPTQNISSRIVSDAEKQHRFLDRFSNQVQSNKNIWSR